MTENTQLKKPGSVDLHVGGRIRLRRMMLGLSQQKLGETLGMSFQQVQKYEKGTNRIGAGRLYSLSLALKAPVSFFFEGIEDMDTAEDATTLMDLMQSPDAVKLSMAFEKISDPDVRNNIIKLTQAIAKQAV
ncbi:MAG: helix-turn-helix transcriptional regulator [Roseibium sp.]